jgi:hypothetical protein
MFGFIVLDQYGQPALRAIPIVAIIIVPEGRYLPRPARERWVMNIILDGESVGGQGAATHIRMT